MRRRMSKSPFSSYTAAEDDATVWSMEGQTWRWRATTGGSSTASTPSSWRQTKEVEVVALEPKRLHARTSWTKQPSQGKTKEEENKRKEKEEEHSSFSAKEEEEYASAALFLLISAKSSRTIQQISISTTDK